ncbi:hypothetical protein DFH09DRAFT_1323368 [Mycena vulgaris]|nr:hypothetical protein DFH09DRAFT_1323368 [Mycena vulgaris]
MDPIVNLYYRLYDRDVTLASKHPLQPNHSNLSSIDIDYIPPSYTVKNITRFILEREAEVDAYATAELYIDRRDARPAAADMIIDIEQGASTKPLMALRIVLCPDSRRTAPPCTGMAPSKSQLMALFPNPGPSLTVDTAVRWPGISAASTAAFFTFDGLSNRKPCRFFKNKGFHNHTLLHLLTEYSLGAGPAHLTAIWNQHVALERPAFQSPHFITTETFTDHLGDEAFYQAYLHFFSDVVLKTPVHAVLEEWIFSSKANYDTKKDGQRPEMLNRLLAGVMHPLIYVGFGLDFSLPGLVAEGTHFSIPYGKEALSNEDPNRTRTSRCAQSGVVGAVTATHVRHVDHALGPSHHGFNNLVASFDEVHSKFGEDIKHYAAEWIVEGVNPKEVAKKVEELTFLNVMIYVVGGWRDGGFRQAEFTFEVIDGTLFVRAAGLTMESIGRVREGGEGEKDVVLVVAGWLLLEVPVFVLGLFALYYQTRILIFNMSSRLILVVSQEVKEGLEA